VQGNDENEAVQETEEKKYKIKGSLIKREDGSLEPTKMFDILELDLDDYSDIEFTESEARRIRMHVMKMRTGIQAMAPLLCAGPVKCPFRYRCPIVDRNLRIQGGKDIDFPHQDVKKFPLLRQCIFERDLLDFQRRRYIEEYDVDVDSPTEMGMINKLAELDLYEMRATMILAHGDDKGEGLDLLKQQTTSVSMTGEEIKRMETHPAFELKEKIFNMRDKILQSMVGTRREQYKQAAALKKQDFSDPSTAVAGLRERIAQIEKETAIEAEFVEHKGE
jgi:hypothetical protein